MSRRSSLPLAVLMLLPCCSATAGYTHYYTWQQKPDDSAVRESIEEMRRIVDARRAILAGPEGQGPPEISPSRLTINGIGDNAHEPFVFPMMSEFASPSPKIPNGFNFCKTLAKPYDEVVTACLLVARDHFSPSVLKIGSDGSWAEGDWEAGAKLYSSVLGRLARNPMPDQPDFSPPSHPLASIPMPLLACAIGALVIALLLRRRSA